MTNNSCAVIFSLPLSIACTPCCSDIGGSRLRNISRVMELENGTLTVTDYTSFLETPVVVTGAVFASIGYSPAYYGADISDKIILDISAREVETQGKQYYDA